MERIEGLLARFVEKIQQPAPAPPAPQAQPPPAPLEPWVHRVLRAAGWPRREPSPEQQEATAQEIQKLLDDVVREVSVGNAVQVQASKR